MGKQRNEMRKIHSRKREKAKAQLRKFATGELPGDKLNRLARKILRKTSVVKAAAKASGGRAAAGA
jgi:hypothetical protein